MAKGTSSQQPTLVLSTYNNVVDTPMTNVVVSSESISTQSTVGGMKERAAGNNSAAGATPSRQHDVSGKEKDAVKAPPITQSYHRRRGKSAMESTADPTYVPESTPLSSSEQGTFHFTRSNKRSTPSSRRKRSETMSTGKRKLFPLNKGPLGIPPPDKSYITSSSDRCRYYAEQQNFL
ncbi:hypothetical protein PIB30_092109 [Stylosanthes scabra]|uniref:Uncharacterized protein n=1 Tax=Stylosanthes scabra TaxID=79078 RepID=A0ABU6ZTJ9_9FABA|nr:hypothetical protein [Stylosanthes scabra]